VGVEVALGAGRKKRTNEVLAQRGLRGASSP
jgi:hypothetical protein